MNLELLQNKKVSIALAIWGIVTLLYVLSDLWNGFTVNVMERSYVSGQSNAIGQIIQQAENKECKPFNVFIGERKVDLINAACVSMNNNPNPSTSLTPQPVKK